MDLIVSTVLFDDSRMLEFLQEVKRKRKWRPIPFVCMRVTNSQKPGVASIENVDVASQALGAVAFLNIDNYAHPEKTIRTEIEKFVQRAKEI